MADTQRNLSCDVVTLAAGSKNLVIGNSGTINSNLTLSLNVVDDNRLINIVGSPVSLGNWFNQSVRDDAVISVAGISFTESANIAVGSVGGTKVGTATTQKLGFFNAAPVVQRTRYGSLACSCRVINQPICQ